MKRKQVVTTFFINEKIDQGDILLKEEVNISDKDNFGSLYIKLSSVGSRLLIKTIKGVLSKSLKASKQDFDESLKIAPKLSKVNTRIDWNKSQKEIIGMIRGLSPKPGAWTVLKNGDNEIRMKILEAKKSKAYLQKRLVNF